MRPPWLLFGGKGGVGKTTCAAAWALGRAETGARVLVLSTDPAHSLGDVFDKKLGSRPSRVITRRGRLEALELDAAAAVSAWLEARRPALGRLIDRGTLLDRQDIARVLDLPLPGLDELAAFLTLGRLDRAGEYDEIVVDTAPTGHTLRLLDMPRLVHALADLLDAMHARHTQVARALGGATGADALVDELRAEASVVERRLHDPARCGFYWVTLPEPVAIQETLDGLEWLWRGRFPVRGIIVNRLTILHRHACEECRARATTEREALAPLAARAPALRPAAPHVVPDQPGEPRGTAALRRVAAELQAPRAWREIASVRSAPKPPAGRQRPGARPARSGGDTLPALSVPEISLLLFGGKGGVGKTTCAAAAALAAAARAPLREVRLISTDPAPSLGDVLLIEVGDRWTSVPGRWSLHVRELDAAAVFEEYRGRYQAAVQDFFDGLRAGSVFDAAADRAVFERLFDLAPPGVDEVVALLTVVDLVGGEAGSLLVVDTAPTGHTLRLLGMHADVQQWVELLMHLVIKYRLAARAEALAQDLVRLSRGLRAFRALLADRARAQFVAVVRPAVLPRLETDRMVRELRRLGIASPLLIVNAESGGACPGCAPRARAEQQELQRVRRLCGAARGACDIMHAPLRLPPPRGVDALLEWAGAWRSE